MTILFFLLLFLLHSLTLLALQLVNVAWQRSLFSAGGETRGMPSNNERSSGTRRLPVMVRKRSLNARAILFTVWRKSFSFCGRSHCLKDSTQHCEIARGNSSTANTSIIGGKAWLLKWSMIIYLLFRQVKVIKLPFRENSYWLQIMWWRCCDCPSVCVNVLVCVIFAHFQIMEI